MRGELQGRGGRGGGGLQVIDKEIALGDIESECHHNRRLSSLTGKRDSVVGKTGDFILSVEDVAGSGEGAAKLAPRSGGGGGGRRAVKRRPQRRRRATTRNKRGVRRVRRRPRRRKRRRIVSKIRLPVMMSSLETLETLEN